MGFKTHGNSTFLEDAITGWDVKFEPQGIMPHKNQLIVYFTNREPACFDGEEANKLLEYLSQKASPLDITTSYNKEAVMADFST